MVFQRKNTLGLAQALYERHKVLTYPRTDSRALPEDYIETVKKTLGMLAERITAQFAEQILKNGWVRPNKRIFNNAKVSGSLCHHSDVACAETFERAGAETLRPGDEAVSRDVFIRRRNFW